MLVNPHLHTEQEILNSSFDENGGTLVTQNVVRDSNGNLIYSAPLNDVQANQLMDRLEFGLITDNAKVLQVGVKNGTITTVTTVTTVNTVASLTNTVRQGDLQTQRLNEAILDAAFINGITNNLAF